MKSEIYKDKICTDREEANPWTTSDPPHEPLERINVLEEGEDLQEGDVQGDHHKAHQEIHRMDHQEIHRMNHQEIHRMNHQEIHRMDHQEIHRMDHLVGTITTITIEMTSMGMMKAII